MPKLPMPEFPKPTLLRWRQRALVPESKMPMLPLPELKKPMLLVPEFPKPMLPAPEFSPPKLN